MVFEQVAEAMPMPTPYFGVKEPVIVDHGREVVVDGGHGIPPRDGPPPQFLKPKIDVYDSPKTGEITATFELPGLRKEDIKLQVQDGQLIVSGQYGKAVERKDKDNKYSIRERAVGRFSRAVRLPRGTKVEDIRAGMVNGILTVTYPRTNRPQPGAAREVFID
jgi:HSP20 family protein